MLSQVGERDLIPGSLHKRLDNAIELQSSWHSQYSSDMHQTHKFSFCRVMHKAKEAWKLKSVRQTLLSLIHPQFTNAYTCYFQHVVEVPFINHHLCQKRHPTPNIAPFLKYHRYIYLSLSLSLSLGIETLRKKQRKGLSMVLWNRKNNDTQKKKCPNLMIKTFKAQNIVILVKPNKNPE